MGRFLEGLKVLDLTQSVSGPTGTLLLAYLGAEIIKIEQPSGDACRGWGPPFAGEFSSMFIAINRGKTSTKIDLSSEAGAAELRRLISGSDVVVQNYRPRTAAKLGIDYDTVTGLNPNVVYCSITGYGAEGPRKDQPGFDAMMQAFSGIMHLTGEPDGQPVRTGPGVLDIGAGMLASIGILGALVDRMRGGTGPWRVDTSLLEIAAFFLNDRLTSYFINGEEPHRMGSAREGMTPYENFRTSDGYVLIAAGTERFWRELCSELGLDHLRDHPDYATNAVRVVNRLALKDRLEEVTSKMSTDDLVRRLAQREIPVSKVNRLSEFVNDPQLAAIDLFYEMESEFGVLKTGGMPFLLNGERRKLPAPPRASVDVIR